MSPARGPTRFAECEAVQRRKPDPEVRPSWNGFAPVEGNGAEALRETCASAYLDASRAPSKMADRSRRKTPLRITYIFIRISTENHRLRSLHNRARTRAGDAAGPGFIPAVGVFIKVIYF